MLGNLTIHGVTRPVTFDVRAKREHDAITGTAEGVLRMTDFGIKPPDLLGFVKVEDEVAIAVRFVAPAVPVQQ